MSENREHLLEQIKVQGDLVRKVKAAKESAEKVSLVKFQIACSDS
jgi:histidyl-tRNA synthetase